MSRIDNMIAELCPKGVPFYTIKEISTSIYRGTGIKREDVSEKGIPCVRYGEIYTTYGIWFDHCKSYVDVEKVVNPKFFEYGDILFAITGESIDDIAKSTAYVGNEKCLAGGDIVVLKHSQNPKFLSYVLASEELIKQKRAGKVKSKVVHASVSSIEQLVVPVPPVQVQEEIVKVLDSYTSTKERLINELKKEIAYKEKQYTYYMNSLLSFSDEGGREL